MSKPPAGWLKIYFITHKSMMEQAGLSPERAIRKILAETAACLRQVLRNLTARGLT